MRILFFIFIVFTVSQAQKKVPDFSIRELKALIKSERPFLLIDARKEKAFKAGHIKGAINQYARDRKLKTFFNKLKKDQLFVIYCQNEKCPYADELAYRLLKLGFFKILVCHQGYEGWKIIDQ